ncbi:Ribosomal protein L24 conjectural [Salinisphaera shabanensis E1L3A]|uniref:Ribosomal protein L24 conjectural n=1 Tax=Salinisphaera shabanensis E1L3A TaxID=1033802 RepID=U2EPW5_9GAMM|nr:Ribosomal protein L24 conjectural [Salinisphaera shabanensis E1L3A]
MEVSYTTAADEFIFRGKTYYFCSGACREAFEVEPARYIRPHRQHGVGPS